MYPLDRTHLTMLASPCEGDDETVPAMEDQADQQRAVQALLGGGRGLVRPVLRWYVTTCGYTQPSSSPEAAE